MKGAGDEPIEQGTEGARVALAIGPRPAPDVLCASAPGKLMIAGEYAVLYGQEALVTAVSRRAFAWFLAQPAPAGPDRPRPSPPESNRSRHRGADSPVVTGIPPEALLARRLAEAARGAFPETMMIDLSEMRPNRAEAAAAAAMHGWDAGTTATGSPSTGGNPRPPKLGLGSSAAAAVAAAGAVFARHGDDLGDPGVREALLEVALEGHRAVAPRGSGVDVAAAVYGGFLRVRRADGLAIAPMVWPAALRARVVYTGKSARTSELVAGVDQLRERRPAEHQQRIDAIAAAADALIAAIDRADAGAAIDAVGRHHDAMADLGAAAGAPIVEERLAMVAELARTEGGAAKPSGAGGGDVAIAFFADEPAEARFVRRCGDANLSLVDLDLGAMGVLSEGQSAQAPSPHDEERTHR